MNEYKVILVLYVFEFGGEGALSHSSYLIWSLSYYKLSKAASWLDFLPMTKYMSPVISS
jgi:hypothetical protein